MSIADVLGTPAPTIDAAPSSGSIGDILSPTPSVVQPEEVSIQPGSSVADQETAYRAMGINLDLAKTSKRYDPNSFNRIHKDATNPDNPSAADLDTMRATNPEGAAIVESQSGPDATGNFGQGVNQFGRDVGGLGTRVTGSAADTEVAKLNDYLNRNVNERFINGGQNIDDDGNYSKPFGQKAGYGTAATVSGIAGGEIVAAALPEVAATGGIGAILGIGRGTLIGSAAGAASEPTNPIAGAKSGAIAGGVLSTVAQGTGAVVRALSKNGTPAELADLASTSDALTVGNGTKPIGIAEVLGRPNLTGEQTAVKLTNLIPSWIPGGQKVTSFLTGAGRSQAQKAAGIDSAIGNASQVDSSEWIATLQKEKALQTPQAKIDMHDPSTFAKYYPQLSPAGQKAATQGMISNAGNKALRSDGSFDPKAFSAGLDDILKVIGDQSVITGEAKYSLLGLKKLADIASNPSMQKSLADAGGSFATTDKIGLLTRLGISASDDIAGLAHTATGIMHGTLLAVKPPAWYGLANQFAGSKGVRNALIGLAQAKTPVQTISALSSLDAQNTTQ